MDVLHSFLTPRNPTKRHWVGFEARGLCPGERERGRDLPVACTKHCIASIESLVGGGGDCDSLAFSAFAEAGSSAVRSRQCLGSDSDSLILIARDDDWVVGSTVDRGRFRPRCDFAFKSQLRRKISSTSAGQWYFGCRPM